MHWYLAIICNVSNIARKLIVDDLDDGPQGAEQTTIDDQTDRSTDQSNGVANAHQQGETSDATRATEEPLIKQTTDDDDVNLFEEEKLNLIDRDDEGAGLLEQTTGQDHSAQQSFQVESATTVTGFAQTNDVPLNLLSNLPNSSQKKKGKRKSLPPKRDPNKPVIIVLDSLSQPRSNATRALKEWIKAEGLARRGMVAEIKDNGYYPKFTQIPMQNNYSDCGLYVLGYAQKFFQDPDAFKTKLLTGEMTAETDWPDMQPSLMRQNLRELIFRLHSDQVATAKATHKAKRAAKMKGTPTSPSNRISQKPSPVVQQSANAEVNTSDTIQVDTEEKQFPGRADVRAVTAPAAADRLGSPFHSKVKTNDARSDATHDVVEGRPSPCSPTATTVASSSTKTPPTRPKQKPVQQRLGNPEVHIPAKSPHIDSSSYVRYEGADDWSNQHAQQPTDPISPSQKPELRSKDGGEIRKPSKREEPASSPARPPRKRSHLSSPLQPRTRTGSHNDPITLDDSQEVEVIDRRQIRLMKEPSPEVIELDRSQQTVLTPIHRSDTTSKGSLIQHNPHKQTLRHKPSVQVVPDPGFRPVSPYGRDVTRALEQSLAEEEERRENIPQWKNSQQPLDCTIKNMDGPVEMYPGSANTVPAMDVDEPTQEDTIAETPEQKRSSPGVDEMDWQAQSSLHS